MSRTERMAYISILIVAVLAGAGGFVLGLDWWDVFLSAGLFAVVVLAIVGLFAGAGGQVQLSPQRSAAIAAGHEDRRTVFESRLAQPIMWILLSLSHSLTSQSLKRWLRKQLVAAGSPNYYTVEEYLALAMAAGLALAVVVEAMYFLLLGQFTLLLAMLALGLGIFLTLYQIHESASKRLAEISRRIPYALDLISLAMGAGANFAEAISTIARERDDDPLNQEFRTVLAEMELGTTRRRAMQNLAERVPLDAMRSIVASVVQAEQLGTPLGTVLHDQATLLRLQRSVRAENRAAVASVRILVPCLLLVIAVMLAVFGPAIIQAVRKGLF